MMTNEEMELAQLIAENYHEKEESYPYLDRRVFVSMDGVITSQDELTDILFIQFTTNDETGNDNIGLFISSPDDTCQDFISLGDLTDEERVVIVPELKRQIVA